MNEKKRGLGRGLNELFSAGDWLRREEIHPFHRPVDRLTPNPCQPHRTMDDEGIFELVQSITERGGLQPILVSADADSGHHRILAGERRWRAAVLARIKEVPAILREYTPSEALELALMENIRRRDLNCIEEAEVLSIPDADDQRALCRLIISRDLSVRGTERLIARGNSAPSQPKPSNPQAEDLQQALRIRFGLEVHLNRRGRGGTLTFRFRSDEELQKLLGDFQLNHRSRRDSLDSHRRN